MKKRKLRLSAVTAVMLCVLISAALLSSCTSGSKEDPWDHSAAFSSDILIPTDKEEVRFTGIEWTGESFSRDIDGNFTSQSEIVRVNTLDYHSVNTVVYDSVENALEGAVSYDRTNSAYSQLLTCEDNV